MAFRSRLAWQSSQMPRTRSKSWRRAFPYTECTAAAPIQPSAIAPCDPVPAQFLALLGPDLFQLRHLRRQSLGDATTPYFS
jgi:hypothetical protein